MNIPDVGMVEKQVMPAEANDAMGMSGALVSVCWRHCFLVPPDLIQVKEETCYEPLWKCQKNRHIEEKELT